jgi:N-acetylmuramoyl-L-alanine amidase
MRKTSISRTALVAALLAACSSPPASSPTGQPSPVPARTLPPSPPTVASFERGITPRQAPPLPTIPLVEGPLQIVSVFPTANQTISVRDSNFVFGSIGNGKATLTINGAPVTVAPNGTYMAFLPVPPPTAPQYELVAHTATDSARLVVPVRVPPARADLSTTGPLVVDSASASPRGSTNLVLRDDEPVRVSIRAPINATAWVAVGSTHIPLALTGGNTFATDITYAELKEGATLYVARGGDTVHFALSRPREPISKEPSLAARRSSLVANYVMLGDSAAQRDTDATIIGRDIPAGTYKWMFLPGTIVEETGRSGDNVRVRLDSQLEVWVDSVRALAPGYPAPRRVVGAMALVPAPEWVDIVFPMSSPPPYLIEQNLKTISLTMYGTNATPETIKFLQNDSLVRFINWEPVATDRLRFDIQLTDQPFGYLVMFEPGRGFILRLRRTPKINIARPLEGLTLTVDPGHPPGGAIGPTGYTEAQGVLAVAFKLRDILEQRGAKVVMTRTDMRPVDLHERSVIARRSNSAALLSIHENAFGDGTNPYPNVGTSTLFFHPQSEPLARLVQAGMMREMGLRDLGVHYQNIAIGRTMWMPSLITEGLFLMVPEQEYAAKDPAFQERYARGVADGVEAYFRSLAQR